MQEQTDKKHKNKIILKRLLLAIAAAVVLTAISVAAYFNDNAVGDNVVLWSWVFVHWAINCALFFVIGSGLSQNLRDPSLTLPLNYWAILSIFIFSLMVPKSILLLYAMSIGTLIFSAFNLKRSDITLMSIFISFTLLFSLYFSATFHSILYFAGLPWWLTWIFFSIVLASFTMASQDVVFLRHRLKKRVSELERANRTIKRLASTDSLTGVYNRNHLNNVLHQQLELLGRYGPDLTVAIIDLDHFKSINDNFGHNVGDQVLRTFAQIARNSLRKSDWFGRWGGEEFICVMPHTSAENAVIPMERIRKEFATYSISALPADFPHTVSIGIAQAKLSDTVDTVLARADNALYRAKASGRNMLIAAD